MHGNLPCGKDFAFSLVELHEAAISSYLQPIHAPLEDTTTLWHINHYFLVCVELAEVTVLPMINGQEIEEINGQINEDFRQN